MYSTAWLVEWIRGQGAGVPGYQENTRDRGTRVPGKYKRPGDRGTRVPGKYKGPGDRGTRVPGESKGPGDWGTRVPWSKNHKIQKHEIKQTRNLRIDVVTVSDIRQFNISFCFPLKGS